MYACAYILRYKDIENISITKSFLKFLINVYSIHTLQQNHFRISFFNIGFIIYLRGMVSPNKNPQGSSPST